MYYFLVVYSSNSNTYFRLYDYTTYDLNYINSYGWVVIAVYRLYNNRFIKKSDYYRLVNIDKEIRLKKINRLNKIINLIELIKNAI